MDAVLYVSIIEQTLLPFLESIYPDGHCLMQDNDPKHTSNRCKDFLTEKSINWWKTPPESPNLNPIENLWHELKEYQYQWREVKPKTKDELVNEILGFGTL